MQTTVERHRRIQEFGDEEVIAMYWTCLTDHNNASSDGVFESTASALRHIARELERRGITDYA